jgi:hypothetical protein
MHSVFPGSGWYLPGRQCVHAMLGVSTFAVNSPAKHGLHSPLPVASWYCPLWQFRQTVAADKEYFPATQVGSHVDAVVAADVVEYLPAVHSVHVAAPSDVLYLPATQFTQTPPSGPVLPALHLQWAWAPLPSGEYEFDGQSPHVFDVAPTFVEYFPAPQFVHAAFPVPVLYVPATHDVHGPPLLPDVPALQIQLAPVPLFATDWEFVGQFSHDTNV